MKSSNYQMITVVDYVKLLDNDIKYLDNDVKQIRNSIEKYLLQTRRAVTNAKILESLLG